VNFAPIVLFADRAGVEATRALFSRDWGFKSLRVVSRERNWSLARNVVDGVSAVVAQRGRAIVLEDDIEVSPAFLAGMYTLYPGASLARNIGHGGSGTHGGASGAYEVPLAFSCPPMERLEPRTDPSGYRAFRNYFLSLRPFLWTRIARRLGLARL
jgi:hypothetical protein